MQILPPWSEEEEEDAYAQKENEGVKEGQSQ